MLYSLWTKYVSGYKSIIFVVLILILVIESGYIIFNTLNNRISINSVDSQNLNTIVPSVKPALFPEDETLNNLKQPTTVKKYNSYELGLFFIEYPELPDGTFVIGVLKDKKLIKKSGLILSQAMTVFSMDSLFDVYKDKVYVVDGSRGDIKIYNITHYEKDLSHDEYYSFGYVSFIPKPNDKVGNIYSIKCQEEICKIRSATHEEAGCDFELNLVTNKYSIPECSPQFGEEFYGR